MAEKSVFTTDLGGVTAYSDAKAHGYTGTREEFGALLANAGQNLTEAEAAKQAAAQSAAAADKRAIDAENAAKTANARAGDAETAAANAERDAQTATDRATAAKTAQQAAANSASAAATSATNAENAANRVADSMAQIAANKEAIGQLKDGKISKFYASSQWNTNLPDSDDGRIVDLKLYGKSNQDGTPTPDNPVEIKSVVKPRVKVCGKNLINVEEGKIITRNENYSLNVDENEAYTVTISQTLNKLGSSGNKDAQHWYIFKDAAGTTLKQGTIAKLYFSSVGETKKAKDTITAPRGAVILVLDISAYFYNPPTLAVNYVQVEKGTTATAYEPYTEQTVTLPYTLNAIPVTSGGNVTIDGQQYIADYVDVERGKLVRMVDIFVDDGKLNHEKVTSNDITTFAVNLPKKCGDMEGVEKRINYSSAYKQHFSGLVGTNIDNVFGAYSLQDGTSRLFVNDFRFTTANEYTAWLSNNPISFLLILQSPTETALTADEIAAFKALASHYPVTNVSTTSDQLDGYTVFDYPISLANGWNYVKQQIGDTRDYLYDIDLVTAEVYVNSAYATAIAEMEV